MTATRTRPTGWRLDLSNDLEALAEPWQDLALRSRNIFSSWTWAQTWLRTMGTDGEPVVATVHDESDQLRVVVPLVTTRKAGVRLLRFMGHGPADELGPVTASEDEAAGLAVLREVLDHAELEWDVFLGERMPDGSSAQWKAARSLQQESSPVVEGPSGWEAYLKERSSNFRSQVRSRERRIGKKHALEFRQSDGDARDLDLLFHLHRKRWGDEETPFLAAEAFHREFAAAAASNGWLRFWIMELDGSPVAAWYGFRFGGVESYYQAGREPERSRDSVGFVLLAHSIRAAFEDGITEYRLLRGDEDYKDRFATRERHRETFAVPGTTAGKLAVTAGATLIEHEVLRRVTGAIIE